MKKVRTVARLDIKGPNLIKGIHLEGLRVVGNPHTFALDYYQQGIDEIIYMDCVASLYERNGLTQILEETSESLFIPLTAGGGIRSLSDMQDLLRSGADKLAINTQAIKTPKILTLGAEKFGRQCIVLSIEAKKRGEGKWEAYIDNGREHTGLDVLEWAKYGESLGAGEILLTSVDREGTCKGFDIPLIKAVSENVSIPVVASGGCGGSEDVVKVVREGLADAVAIAHAFHYKKLGVQEIRQKCQEENIQVRRGL